MTEKNNDRTNKSRGHKNAQRFQVTEKALLMEFLIDQMPHKSRNNIKSLLGHKQIFVDGQPVSQFNHALLPGQEVEVGGIRVAHEQKFKEYTIVYEDPYVIVIDKAAGLLAMAPEKTKKISAYGLLKRHVERQNEKSGLFIVYGLDRETSGLMMFAKKAGVKDKLLEDLDGSKTERNYIAVVEGVVEQKEGTIESYLREDKAFRMHSSPDPKKGTRAVTRYTVIRNNAGYTFLNVTEDTHVKNQIRVHLQEMGHPIVGDRKYESASNPMKRIGLHSQQLTFSHPVSGRIIKLETKTPRSFLRMFQE